MAEPLPPVILDRIEHHRSIEISFQSLSRGIDNYRVDVKLSTRFGASVRKLIRALADQYANPANQVWDHSKLFEKVRNHYRDLMSVLIHRIKTDLNADHVALLQFAPIKYVLTYSRKVIDEEIDKATGRLTEYSNRGATEALTAQHRLYWLRKNYDRILFQINRQVFAQIQRAEERSLAPERNQFMGDDYELITQAILTPLHYTSDLSALALLVNEFTMWSPTGDDTDFNEFNRRIEDLVRAFFPDLDTPSLTEGAASESSISEIYDELGGLFKTQVFMGLAADTKSTISETFSWFEIPENISAVFDARANEEFLDSVRKNEGRSAHAIAKKEFRQLERFLKALLKEVKTIELIPQLVASRNVRKSLNASILEHVDLKVICQFLIGQLSIDRVQSSVAGSYRLNAQQLKSLEELRKSIRDQIRRVDENDMVDLLIDLCRYRQQLKYYRFAHRAFNRLNLLHEKDNIKLSESAGTLYKLPTSDEIEEDTAKICHHTILKADVRGSTTVTDELQKKGLNPASYFSTRFFNPINKILDTYDASKVFIEGDAIILSFLEYDNSPQEWFSVARACGYARDMLKITSSNNRYSAQMGLPVLELGVGICYSSEAPRYLYDGEHPIMISGAIGLADRMSGCSWNLRATMDKGLFNVHVLRIADGEMSKGEKGQHYLRYNVNGISLDRAAFDKLKTEVQLRSLRMELNGIHYLFHVGQYPDANGRTKELVVREGRIGLWQNAEVHDDPESSESYFEVVVNRKVLHYISDSLSNNSTATAG